MTEAKDRWTFAKTIYENPFDDTPRLVFADWLEERGHVKAGQRQREYVRIRMNGDAMLMRTHVVGRQTTKEIFLKLEKGITSLFVKQDGECLIGQVKQPPLLVLNLAISWVRWIQRKKTNIKRNVTAEQILWVSEAVLLDACEAAGVKLDNNLTLAQAGA